MLEILGKIGFDWQVALANLINFAIIFLILQFLVFKPLARVIKERKARIDKGLADTEKAEAVLAEADSRKEDLLKDAYKESQEIISSAKDRSDSTIAAASEKAQVQAGKIVDGANSQAESILKKADADLANKSVDLVISGIEKVLEEKMTSEVNEKYIKEVLAK